MKKNIYLLILSPSLGGTEIRFLRIFKKLKENGAPLKLIICEGFLETVLSFNEFKNYNVFNKDIKQIKPFKNYSEKSFNVIYNDIAQIVEKNATIHFNQNLPASHFGHITQKTIYTFNENSLYRFTIRDHLFFLLTLIRANSIDILDPIIYSRYKKLLFFKKNINLTTAGSINPLSYKFDCSTKKNSIVFAGLFSDQKQVMRFVNAIDTINASLVKNNILESEFYIIGDGPLTNKVNSAISKLQQKGITIHSGFYKDYKNIIESSKIFLSIQKYNNYPSNSLMEAMACGNIPLVTDNGSTRLIAKEDFSYYIPENFSPLELTTQIIEIFSLNKIAFEKKASMARNTIINEYCIDKSAEYYSKLYEEKN